MFVAKLGKYASMTRNALATLAGTIILSVTLSGLTPAAATQMYSPSEAWAWSQLKRGEIADFDRRCGNHHPQSPTAQVTQSCREISAHYLVTLLTRDPWRESMPFQGLRITGADIVGDLNLANAKLIRPLVIDRSRFYGVVDLSQATTDSVLVFKNSIVDGAFHADFLRSEKSVDLSGTNFHLGASLNGATIPGQLRMLQAHFSGQLEDDQRRALDLGGATIGGAIFLAGSTFLGEFYADSLQAVGIVGSDCSFRDVNLGGAKITSNLNLTNAAFSGPVSAIYLRVDGNIDISGATVGQLDLAGAWIGGELRLARMAKYVHWSVQNGRSEDFSLRNAHIGTLVDSKLTWPSGLKLHLAGITFDQLGGAEEEADMLSRPPSWWDREWAQRDSFYSPAPYVQLAKVFAATGNRGKADQIRYLGWVRERRTQDWPRWLWSGVLEYAVGFGIGVHTFNVVYAVILLSVLLGIYLRFRVPAISRKRRGLGWCVFAGFDRLFPVLQINKGFAEFFDNPEHNQLTPMQNFLFSSMRIVGLALGAILAAAITGLAQGP